MLKRANSMMAVVAPVIEAVYGQIIDYTNEMSLLWRIN
jgi:hypothetical protein